MTEKTFFVAFNDDCVKVKSTNFENLLQKAKTKLEVSSNCRLQYQEKNGKWVTICNDEDLEDIDSATTDLRLALKEKSSEKFPGSSASVNNGFETHGGTHNHTGDNVVGTVDKRTMPGNDYVGGDKITAKNLAKVGTVHGTMKIGGQ